MQVITSWSELLEITAQLHNKGLNITNFYPNESEMSDWLGSMFLVELKDGCACFAHKTVDAVFLFIFIDDMNKLSNILLEVKKRFTSDKLVFDWIYRNEIEKSEVKQLAESGGFTLHTSLRRMSQIRKNSVSEDISEVEVATNNDIVVLCKMLNEGFNPISERIPTIKQIETLILQKSILVRRVDDEIAGMAIIDIQKKTMYLKHLLTNPKFRRQGIANSLLDKAFFLSKECIRFILWVKEDNLPAINLYKKFNYEFEVLGNYTFVSK